MNKIGKEIRFAIIRKKLYVWDYGFLHYDVLNKMGENANNLNIFTGTAQKEKGKWKFHRSDLILVSINNVEFNNRYKRYLEHIINKDYSWVDKYISFKSKWNEYKREIKKVI